VPEVVEPLPRQMGRDEQFLEFARQMVARKWPANLRAEDQVPSVTLPFGSGPEAFFELLGSACSQELGQRDRKRYRPVALCSLREGRGGTRDRSAGGRSPRPMASA
jgi:hypothetical protein